MDIIELKNYIYENEYVEQLLESIGCHHIKYHSSGNYWSCGNKDGDNQNAITLYNNENLICVNYTRTMTKLNKTTDIIDLVMYSLQEDFPKALTYICNEIGISYYKDFEKDIPESLKILKTINELNGDCIDEEDEKPLKPISENILAYYMPYVNDMFKNDNISYLTQREFEVGIDEYTNRITIPIRDELGNLVGVKGRWFGDYKKDNQLKYLYIEPCAKSKILYGLFKTMPYIKSKRKVFVFEAEKSVMQCWSYGDYETVSTGGKKITQKQIDMLVRLGSQIIICFDGDVEQEELEDIAERFPDGIEVYAIIDKDKILDEKESPSDNYNKWQILKKNNIYRIK